MKIKSGRVRLGVLVMVAFAYLLCIAISVLRSGTPAIAQEPLKPLAQPPEDQTYVGSKNCSSCHFDQYLVWRQTKHAKAFDILPAKYRTDASCLKCHTTGHGEPTGYKDASTAALAGTSCEACHGPASKHVEISKQFSNKKLSPEQEAYVRSTTHKILPGNSCTQCHVAQGHKKHPEYDKN